MILWLASIQQMLKLFVALLSPNGADSISLPLVDVAEVNVGKLNM
jgi:hypothetical protein